MCTSLEPCPAAAAEQRLGDASAHWGDLTCAFAAARGPLHESSESSKRWNIDIHKDKKKPINILKVLFSRFPQTISAK